jgi:sortase A
MQTLIIRICATIMVASGFVIIFTTIFPIISYEWEAAQKYPMLISSLVDEKTADFKFTKKDSTKLSSWFDDNKGKDFVSQRVSFFTLSVPKLRIDNATVAVGTEDLSQYLILYPGTALPGKIGNTVVFGHSILPQFFDPKNYLSMFSTIYKLKPGDEIYANYDGATYTYRVSDMFEVKPTELDVLDQTENGAFISLVTCSPPGDPFKPKRLVVRAKLIPNYQALAN